MNIVKGISRLQSNLESLIQDAESSNEFHLKSLKALHVQLSTFLLNPVTIDALVMEQWVANLMSRSRTAPADFESKVDLIAQGLRWLSVMRQGEIGRSCGPDSVAPSPTLRVVRTNKVVKAQVDKNLTAEAS
jgi:hypothetical protein